MQLAAWFHDVVYDPQRKDNEEQSAVLLQKFALQAGLVRHARNAPHRHAAAKHACSLRARRTAGWSIA